MITQNVILDAQVHEYAADGDTTRARKALLAARILTAIGIVSGIGIVVIAITTIPIPDTMPMAVKMRAARSALRALVVSPSAAYSCTCASRITFWVIINKPSGTRYHENLNVCS